MRRAMAAIAATLALAVPVLAGCSASEPSVDAGAASTTTSSTAEAGSGGVAGGALGRLQPEATGAFVGEAAQRTLDEQTGSFYFSMTLDEGGPDEIVLLQVEGTYDQDRGVTRTVLDISGLVERAPEALASDPDEQAAMRLVFREPIEVLEDDDTTYLRAERLTTLLKSPTDWVTMPLEEDGFGSIASAFELGDLTEFLDSLDEAGEVHDLGQEELDGVVVWHYEVEIGDRGSGSGGGLFGAIAGAAGDQGTVEVWIDDHGVIHKMTAVGGAAAVLPVLGADFGGGDLATLDLGPGDVTLVIELYGLGEPADIDIPSPSDTTPLDDL